MIRLPAFRPRLFEMYGEYNAARLRTDILSGITVGILALPLAIAFAGSGLGALLAGWASTRLLERGVSVNRVRKGVMLVSALLVAPLPSIATLALLRADLLAA